MSDMNDVKSLSFAKRKFWRISFGAAIVLIVVVVAFGEFHVLGLKIAPLIALASILGWFYLLYKFSPRCQNCGQGIYSVIEVGRVPLVVRWPHGEKCLSCGKNLNE
jgi:hypothetical protein